MDIGTKVCIVISTVAALRVTDREGRKAYEHHEDLEPHFAGSTRDLGYLDNDADGKALASFANLLKLLMKVPAEAASLPVAATGLASVARYAVMQREDVLSVYCPRVADLRERLPGKETDQFANVELIESDQQPLYFDTREEDGFRWASPVQTYLELMAGDKRDQETAEQVRAYFLDRLGVVKQ